MDPTQKTTSLRQLATPAERELANLELSFLDPQVRRSDRPELLLAEDFQEFGASGQVFGKADVLASLKTEADVPRSVDDMQVRMLAMNIALVTYCMRYSPEPAAESLRSSVWVHREGRWQMVFHQGTPRPAAA